MTSSAPRAAKRNQGFTIMEVALAATVLAFTLVGMIGVVEAGTQMLDLSRKQTLAAQILHGEIEQLHLQSWPMISGQPNISAGTPSFYSATQVGYSGPATTKTTPCSGYLAFATLSSSNDPSFARMVANYPQAANIFTLSRTVTCLDPSQTTPSSEGTAYTSAPLLLQVTFTITWKGVTGRSYSRSATALVTPNGLSMAFQRS